MELFVKSISWICGILMFPIAILFVFSYERIGLEECTKTTINQHSASSIQNRRGVKTILYWNTFFQDATFRFGYGRKPFITHHCPVNLCRTTNDSSVIDSADAVMIHMPLVDHHPPRPRPGQKFVYFQKEPHRGLSNRLLHRFRGYFNLTLTYRAKSDIPIKYAWLEHSPNASKNVWIDPKDKPKMAVWVVSHCNTPSQRELYVKELRKYVDIDVYGQCGKLECPKNKKHWCYAMFEQKYKFYLSLENDVCRDYVSEKLFHPLRYNIIPVVFGGADYQRVAPPHSVINIQDFSSAEELADYLIYLTNNATAYNEYFSWKSIGFTFEMNPSVIMGQAMCRLCEILHDDDYKYRDYTDIKTWWTTDMCDPRAVKRLLKRG